MNLNNIFKPILAAGVFALSLTSCYEDKGNYDYSDVEQILITFGHDEEGFTLLTTDVAAMRNTENIEIKPTVISSIAGEIDETNTDYEFDCRINYQPEGSNQAWYDIDSLRTKDVSFFANIPAGNYKFWYTVKNKKTGVTRSAQGNVKIIITTLEGWMVASNPGPDNRSRLDMIFTDSQGVERVATDLFEETSAPVYNTRSIVMNTSKT